MSFQIGGGVSPVFCCGRQFYNEIRNTDSVSHKSRTANRSGPVLFFHYVCCIVHSIQGILEQISISDDSYISGGFSCPFGLCGQEEPHLLLSQILSPLKVES